MVTIGCDWSNLPSLAVQPSGGRLELELVSRPRLSPARRIRRGFTRLGFALAVLTLAIGAGITVFASYDAASSARRSQAAAACLKAARASGKFYYDQHAPQIIDATASGCPVGPYLTVAELYEIDTTRAVFLPTLVQNMLAGLAFVLALGAGGFAFPWGIGWIFSGFFQD